MYIYIAFNTLPFDIQRTVQQNVAKSGASPLDLLPNNFSSGTITSAQLVWIDYKALLYFFVDSGEDTGVKEVNPFAQLMADLSGYSQYSKVWLSWTMKFTDGFDNFFSF